MSKIVISAELATYTSERAELMASIIKAEVMEDNIKEIHININGMVKGSSVPARNRLKTLPTF